MEHQGTLQGKAWTFQTLGMEQLVWTIKLESMAACRLTKEITYINDQPLYKISGCNLDFIQSITQISNEDHTLKQCCYTEQVYRLTSDYQ